MADINALIGEKIVIISISNVRYIGKLHSFKAEDSSLILQHGKRM